jgi:hypothetical protein
MQECKHPGFELVQALSSYRPVIEALPNYTMCAGRRRSFRLQPVMERRTEYG